MKDMTSMATTMMTEEEKAEVEKQLNVSNKNGGPAAQPSIAAEAHKSAAAPSTSAVPTSQDGKDGKSEGPSTPTTAAETETATSLANKTAADKTAADKERERQEQARRKAEQREKLREHEKARRKALDERVVMLTKKMLERLRPFVEAKNPGAVDDAESTAFADKMRREVEDLKLESFGVEVMLVIGLTPTWSLMDCSSF